MTLSIVQAVAVAPTANSAPVVVTFPAPVTPGNRLVFVVSNSGSPWASVPPGVSLDAHGDDAGRYTDVYSRQVATGDGTTYTFTPSGTTGAGRGAAFEVASSVGSPVFDVGAASDAASDTTRTVTLPAGTKTGNHLTFAAVGLGGTSGGSDAVAAPYATRAPTPLDSGRLHVATHFLTGTTFPPAVFSWLTARRSIAVAATYAEQTAIPATTTAPTNVAAALIAPAPSNTGGGTFTYAIAQVSGAATVPLLVTAGRWAVPRHGTETLVYDVTVTHSGGAPDKVERFTVAPAGSSGPRTVRKVRVAGAFV